MSNLSNSNSYRSIAKGTAMMGGVQVFNILINVIRGKLVAMFLGPGGMGVSSLLNSTVTPIQQFTSLGLPLSIVKSVAELNEKDIQEKYDHISLIKMLLLLTAVLGAVIIIILSPYLSKWTFGDTSYTWHFVALSVMIIFTTLSNGEQSILQGAHSLKRLAYSSLIGSVTGLIIGVPLYFFWGNDGIVPAMITLSIVTYLFYRYHETRLFNSKIYCSFSKLRESKPIIKALISLGLITMISALIGTVSNYAINTYIRYEGSLEDVGFFQAANSITNQYVALVFSAMSMDYFPRLTAAINDREKIANIVNAQTEIVLLVISPIICLMICFSPMLIEILLTDEFMILKPIIRIFALSVLFKAIAYPMGYISFAKGDKQTFFWLEGIYGNIVLAIASIFCYHYWGLYGLGISLVLTYLISTITYFYITKKFYQYRPNRTVIRLYFIMGLFTITCFSCSFIRNVGFSYLLMGLLTVINVIVSGYALEKRLNILGVLKRKR